MDTGRIVSLGENNMKRKLTAIGLALLLCFSSTACDLDEDYDDYDDYDDWDDEDDDSSAMIPNCSDDQSWVIYWYLCGSDLESDGGAASGDLDELMEVSLPENVKFVIETGGASYWENDVVNPDYIQRYLYSSDGLELIDEQPLANMGSADTFADFLQFGKNSFQADKTGLIFWNHGGGSVSGVSFDENFDYDSLTLSEMEEAFHSVYDLPAEELPFEMVGFDTCLMATVDTASVISDVAHYMVASEEYEPGFGWYYTGWVQALADHPGLDGAQLGQVICDSYYKECDFYWQADEITLSVVDLTKIDPLLKAYEAMGAEAMSYALEDPSFFGEIGRMALNTENYGGNTRSEGYSNMLDLGHLAENCSELLPQLSSDVLKYLNYCVVYQVKGDYRESANGLSCYFSYNGDLDDLYGFKEEGYSDSFKYFFDYGIAGNLEDKSLSYIESFGYEPEEIPEEIPELSEMQLDPDKEYPVSLDDDGFAVLQLDEETTDLLKGVYFQLAYMDEEEDMALLLGQDNDIVADWDKGCFTDNYRGVWGAIDDHLVYMEVSEEAEDYTAFSVPVLLNGEDYNLRVIYDYNSEEFVILGARQEIDDNGMSDKNLIQLKEGDEITTIHYIASVSGDDDFEAVPMETFTVTENTSFKETDLGDGCFIMMFELVDFKNNSAFSEAVALTVDGENIDVEILD